jgi:hypothetical protein
MSTTIERLDGEARERLIRWIRHRMEEFGITLPALAESLESDVKSEQAVAYRAIPGTAVANCRNGCSGPWRPGKVSNTSAAARMPRL